ncbi:MAG: hypothetical protein ABFQ65_00435 [Nanoarchaeota archaeon]
MKFNFRKISAVIASGLMTVSAVGFAAAANFPAPFVVGGSADGAVVYGTGAGALDQTPANSIGNYLSSKVTVGSGAPTGESVLLAKSSDNLNIGDTWGVFTGTIDDTDLPTLLADGIYTADDNDDFDYEQSIKVGSPILTHFRDSDYESEVGLSERTPTLGFQLGSSTFVMNYTLDFIDDAESDVVSGDMDDFEGSDLVLFGKTYYISDFKNGTTTGQFGKLTLLDSASIATVSEGETVTVTSGGSTYEVSISFIDADEVKFIVNGQEASTSKLQKGNSAKLSDGAYIGVRDISKLEVSGETGSSTFSIGTGKLELTHGSDIKLNDDTINGVKAYLTKTSGSSGSEKMDKIVIEWRTDEEEFLSSASELEMPGFGGIKFTMSDFVRSTEEKVSIDPDGDTSIQLSLPVEDGMVNFNILYSDTTGNFTGLGKASDERLVTSNTSSITFTEKSAGNDLDSWMVASYAVTSEAESYLLRAKITYDSSAVRNLTTIDKMVDGTWTQVCEDKKEGDSCNIGDVSLTIGTVLYTSGGTESVALTGGSNVEFDTIYTKGGLKIYLPYLAENTTTAKGGINVTQTLSGVAAGNSHDSFQLHMDSEDKDDTIGSGHDFYFTIDDTSSNNLQVKDLVGTGSGGANGLEVGDSTSTYEAYIVGTNNETAPRIMHYTNPDEDYAEVYYPEGDSESYAQVYLTELGTTLSAAGQMVFKDSEKSSWQDKNVVVVGGSCINSAAADLLGGALCEGAFTDVTGVGAGQYVVQSFADGFTSGNIALLVAGYHAADTVAAASRLIEPGVSVDTTAGTKYIGTVGVSGSSTMSKVE